ncbi:MAG: lipid-A-disaccharide synthase-related protein [Leptolyngbyaceae cyanobacterium MO_188.B28]|nr:lipid-A-disaccharide synthase-related protein [Leptolyngbyaceae cyanobacterium MO_188.B28]
MTSKQVLFLSNGHGEDLNASLVLQALAKTEWEIGTAAMPLVGAGNAYRKLNVPIIGPTQTMPSGGIIYTNLLNWIKDLFAGLIGLIWRQLQAVRQHSRQCDLIFAAGDIVPIVFAHLTGRPYTAFIVSTSSYYEGRLRLPWITERCLRSPRCLQIFTRDAFTAKDLQQRGIAKAVFAGYPIMDVLTPIGKDLHLQPDVPMIALLPGSRLPEALNNLALQLQLCSQIAKLKPMQFRAALVPSITEADLAAIAQAQNWRYRGRGCLEKTISGQICQVHCLHDAFPDILHQCNSAIGMAGTAVEQAVGLGKPVVQIVGAGPQFTYRFAEAQMRLLGISVKTVGKRPATPTILQQAAQQIIDVLEDSTYLSNCVANGKDRVGAAGGSVSIAKQVSQHVLNPAPSLHT